MDNIPQNRTRAWRRWQKRRSRHNQSATPRKISEPRCLEKDWGLMYTRSEKVRRAKQLRFIYPIRAQSFHSEWFD